MRQVLLRCVRGTRTQPLICVGCSVHYWVSWAINKGGFFRDCIRRRRRRRRHTFASLWGKLIFSLFLLILILVSSIHTLPVNIFILEGGETMLAQEKGNFHAPGENRTRDSLLAFYLRVKVYGGSGGRNRGRATTFWDSEKGGVMKNGPLKGGGSCKYMPVIMKS